MEDQPGRVSTKLNGRERFVDLREKPLRLALKQ